MRLKPDELIAGVPARKLRDLFRRYPIGIHGEEIACRLGLSSEEAAEVLKNLLEQGFVKPSDYDRFNRGWHQLTMKGGAVANAKFLKPLPRARAEKLVKEAISRCHKANLNGDFTHYVKRLHVFGSYNGDYPDLGDVDLIIEIAPRPSIGDFCRASVERVKALNKNPPSFPDWILFGEREVLHFVKGRSPYMTNHSKTQLESGQAAAGAVVLFEADPADVRQANKRFS